MSASGNYLLESDIDNWSVPVGLEEEFATSAVNTSTDIITVTHDIATGTEISFTTTSELPAGLETDTTYYCINVSSTTIKAATSPMLAANGTQINLTDVGTGTHTIRINWSETFATTDVNISTNQITVSNSIDTAAKIRLSSTTTIPAPLVSGVAYYAINIDATHIQLATTPLNAIATTNIVITDVGAGTHSLFVGEGETEADRQDIINKSEDLIERLTRDFFYSKAFTEYIDGNNNNWLFLGLIPDVLTVTKVSIGGVELNTAWYTNDKVAVHLDPENAVDDTSLVELHYRLKETYKLFPKGTNNIEVIGTYGWSTTPDRIKQAAVILCKDQNDASLYTSTGGIYQSEKLGDYTYKKFDESAVTKTTGISEVDDLLKEYIKNKPMLGAG